VLDPTVRVEESSALSGEQRQRRLSDRHYTVDATAGTITLGDGQGSAIPPEGEVRVAYKTGGGTDGNVDTGAVTELDRRLSGVEDATNPAPATGGTDAETTDALVDRAADRFRHRGRAVSPTDYERIAATAVREVGAVTCLPADHRSEDVTVVLAPESDAARPVPSATLRERVTETLQARAPARVAAADRITARGPTYVPVSVDVTVLSRESSVRKRVAERLETLLHPTAGNGGGGWPFGATPEIETVAAAVADVAGVESVRDIDARLQGDDSRPLGAASLPADALICSGDHRVSVDPAICGRPGSRGER
jgi:predicted phage baseplate assembly protein